MKGALTSLQLLLLQFLLVPLLIPYAQAFAFSPPTTKSRKIPFPTTPWIHHSRSHQENFRRPVFHLSQRILHIRQSTTQSALSVMSPTAVAVQVPADQFVLVAYDWCVNLGAPAALVAGAVIATLYENVRGGALSVYNSDPPYTVVAKKLTNILLLSAFGFQIMSIFVTTVMGTMLVSRDFAPMVASQLKSKLPVATTALGFLRQHFEFEYLTARISFLQGLLNWLGAVAIEYTIPRKNSGKAGREMDLFIASSLSLLLVLLLSFYNSHLTFYDNYLHMLCRWAKLFCKRFVTPRPLAILYAPLMLLSIITGIKAILPEKEGNLDDDYLGTLDRPPMLKK